jgi:hypothetical protein
MTNLDNLYGVFNRISGIYSQVPITNNPLKMFASVDEAKSFFHTDAALAVHNECCTELLWALEGSTQLKRTMAFGIKKNDKEEVHWADQFNLRKNQLMNKNQWAKNIYTFKIVKSHLL